MTTRVRASSGVTRFARHAGHDTTLDPLEVDAPEGSVHVSAPSLSLAELWKRMLAERPKKAMLECVRARAAQDFERGYAESVAHHKRRTASAAREPEDLRQAA
jgi:hypothetical protein